MTTIDLNCDLGETVNGSPVADDSALLHLVTSANVACGLHAGDDETMRAVCREAAALGVTIGAHPSYRDREGFGRRAMAVAPHVLDADVREQLDALNRNASDVGAVVRYIKPHGALYNRIAVDHEQARVVAASASRAGLPLLGPAESAIDAAAAAYRVEFFAEAFADRAYLADGRLAPRSLAGSVLTNADEVAARVIRLVEDGTIEAIDGSVLSMAPQSICVHSDTPGALALAAALRSRLSSAGIAVAAFA